MALAQSEIERRLTNRKTDEYDVVSKALKSTLGVYNDVRFDSSDAAPDYIGLHIDNDAATDDGGWKIIKLTYSGSAVTRIQTVVGAWDDREGLF